MKFSMLAILKVVVPAAFFLSGGGTSGGGGIIIGVLAEEQSPPAPRLRLLHPNDVDDNGKNHDRRSIIVSGGASAAAPSSSSGSSNYYFLGSKEGPNMIAEQQQDHITLTSPQGLVRRELQDNQQTWIQLGADIDGEDILDLAGSSVDMSSDGTVLAVGAAANGDGRVGYVRVFKYANNVWTQLGSNIYGEAFFDGVGEKVSLSSDGTTVAVGAPYYDAECYNCERTGRVRVYKYTNSVWTQVGADFNGDSKGAHFFGQSIDLSGDGTVLAALAGGEGGYVRVFKYANNAWTQRGTDIVEEVKYDFLYDSSISLSSDGTVLAVGAPYKDGNGKDSGHVRVFQYVKSVWTQLGSNIDGENADDIFGYSVSLSSDGTIVAVGAPQRFAYPTAGSGYVRVYKRTNKAWTQLGNDIYGEAIHDNFGTSVSLSSNGTVLAVGAIDNNGINGDGSGHVRVFKYSNNAWTQLGSDIDGEAARDKSGGSVSLSSDGTVLATGARFNDGNAGDDTAYGHVRVYQFPTPQPTPQPTKKPATKNNKPTKPKY